MRPGTQVAEERKILRLSLSEHEYDSPRSHRDGAPRFAFTGPYGARPPLLLQEGRSADFADGERLAVYMAMDAKRSMSPTGIGRASRKPWP
jgi:hypothetical protein